MASEVGKNTTGCDFDIVTSSIREIYLFNLVQNSPRNTKASWRDFFLAMWQSHILCSLGADRHLQKSSRGMAVFHVTMD
jgi:hypothetical protein